MDLNYKALTFWIVWLAAHVALFVFGFIKQKDDAELWLLNSIKWSVYTSRGAGLVLALDCALLLLPVCRNVIRIFRNIMTPIFPGLTRYFDVDSNLHFHKVTAYSMLLFTFIHVNAHYTNFFIVEQRLYSALHLTAEAVHYKTWAGTTGHIMVATMFFIYTAAKDQVRKRKFELFWYTHHLFAIFYICLFFHSFGCFVKTSQGVCKGYHSNHFTIPVFALYILERLIRLYRSSQPTILTKIIKHPGRTIELQFEKPTLTYTPGQYVFINIPEVSRWQWHPFTISSTPEEGAISVHIRAIGDWTNALMDRVNEKRGDIHLKVDGPFGAPAEDFHTFDNAVLVCAGIGVTPAAALLKSVWYKYWRGVNMGNRRVWFIWVNRDREAFTWFRSLLHTLEESVPTGTLDIQIYMTGALCTDDIQHITLHDQQKNIPSDAFPQPPDNIYIPMTFDRSNLSRSDSRSTTSSSASTSSRSKLLPSTDPLTSLQAKTQYGRPDFPAVFQRIAEQVGAGSDVGVFYCGPQVGARAVREAVKGVGGKGKRVRFVFRKEKF
ncbi:hypothetical protein HDV00_003455 [Rhizophlyctis rosea]|nr:hypothetical protein HDV00_003455 [Rhizophlyctis rosea]